MNFQTFINKFSRVTTTGNFIPAIDSLRFIAISMVLLFHIQSVISLNPKFGALQAIDSSGLFRAFFDRGWQGVELFFAISGFILALPFAKQHISGGKIVSLKRYFLRRLIRLEPPYIVAMSIYFVLLVMSSGHSLHELAWSYLSTITYTHNIFYGNNLYMTVVAWSLEIEVQFYILAPFLAYVFDLPKHIRRVLLLAAIALFSTLHQIHPVETATLYSYFHFFLIGFLVADLFVVGDAFQFKPFVLRLLTSVAVLGVVLGNYTHSLLESYTFVFAVMTLLYGTLTQKYSLKVFSNRVVYTIGGMCYSIYLLHPLALNLERRVSHLTQVGSSLELNLLIQTILSAALVLIISGTYFALVERPFMMTSWQDNYLLRFFAKGWMKRAEKG